MTPDELRAALGKGKSPFRPFRLRLKDGRTYVVDNELSWCINPHGSVLVILEGRTGPYIHETADKIESVEPFDPDLEAALEAIARIKAGEATIPWEEVKKRLGI
jgi:hypothetical protein